MCTETKSKWLPLISIGLLMVVLPSLIEQLSPWHFTDLTKGLLMGTGIGIELLGFILVKKDKQKLKIS